MPQMSDGARKTARSPGGIMANWDPGARYFLEVARIVALPSADHEHGTCGKLFSASDVSLLRVVADKTN